MPAQGPSKLLWRFCKRHLALAKVVTPLNRPSAFAAVAKFLRYGLGCNHTYFLQDACVLHCSDRVQKAQKVQPSAQTCRSIRAGCYRCHVLELTADAR